MNVSYHMFLLAVFVLIATLSFGCNGSNRPATVRNAASLPLTTPASSRASLADPFEDESYSLVGLRSQHDALAVGNDKVVVVSFFSNGRINVMQHVYVFSDGRKGMIRFVQNWAIQGGGRDATSPNAVMPASERNALDTAISRLPTSQKLDNDVDAFFVSWNDNGKWISRTYKRSNLSQEILVFCDVVSIPRTWL